MNLEPSRILAEQIRIQLAPHCARIEIAGSIRREKAEVGDIEIVAIPKTVPNGDLFGMGPSVRCPRFVAACQEIGTRTKGSLSDGRFIQFATPDGVQVDLFLAHPDNWGLILAIRTGSAEFSHRKLASGWVAAGYHSIDGMLCSRLHRIPVREEVDLFSLIGLPFVHPRYRTL